MAKNTISDDYLMYLRKSRKDIETELSGEGETLKKHEKILTELSRKMGIHIQKKISLERLFLVKLLHQDLKMQKVLSWWKVEAKRMSL